MIVIVILSKSISGGEKLLIVYINIIYIYYVQKFYSKSLMTIMTMTIMTTYCDPLPLYGFC